MRICPVCETADQSKLHAVVKDTWKDQYGVVVEAGCWCENCGASWEATEPQHDYSDDVIFDIIPNRFKVR